MASLGGAGENVAVVVGAGELGSAMATLLARAGFTVVPAGSGRGHHRLPRQRPGRTRQRCGRVGLRRLARPHHTLHLPCI